MTGVTNGSFDANINGIHLHYTVRGSGPVLIAHSGGPGLDPGLWDDFGGLDDFLTVISLHPRGAGLSAPAPDDAYFLADYASDLEALRRHLGLEKPIVMGWSHGGMVAQEYAIAYPDSLSGLILYDTAAYLGEFLGDIETAVRAYEAEPWFADSFAALQQEWAGDFETDEDMTRLWAQEMKFYFKQFNAAAQAFHRRTRDLPVRIAPLKVFNEQEAESMDLRPRLPRIKAPTLVIVGRHDFITNVAMAEEIARHVPDARLEIFEESGHFAMVEEPEKFYQIVKAFVRNN